MRTCSMHPAVRERTVKWSRPQRIYLVQADWVDLGKDVLYWRTWQARMVNTFDVGSIFEHGFKFTAIAGFTTSHHVA